MNELDKARSFRASARRGSLRVRHWAVAILATLPFLGLCVLSIAVIVCGRVDTDDLGRNPHQWPEEMRWLDTGSHHALARFLGDRVWLRREFRQLNGVLAHRLRDGTPGGVMRGSGDWLFLTWSLESTAGRGWLPRRSARAAEVLSNRVVASGRVFRLAVAPNKATVYPGFLNGWAAQRQQLSSQRVARVRTLLEEKQVDGYLDIWPTLHRLSAESEELTYYREDTHWNELGASVAARALVESLGVPWEVEAFQQRESFVRPVDLRRMSGLPSLVEVPRWSVEREQVVVDKVEDNVAWSRYEATSRGPRLLPPLIVLNDSFGDALKTLLPAYFESCTFVRFGAELSDDLRRFLVEAKIVYVLQIERDFLRMSGRAPTPNWQQTRLILDEWDANVLSADAFQSGSRGEG